MGIASPLAEVTDRAQVDNVFVFVSDALRYDHLPARVRERGLTARAIAPSTFTASSLPSLTTGQYPATHRVWRFSDQLRETPPLLAPERGDVGFDAEKVWIDLESGDKPPLQVHRLADESKLADLDPPFVHFVHDVGPHAPYGFENGVFDSTKEFFSEYENRRSKLAALYEQDCRNSADRFLDAYRQLDDRDLLEDTLVVFTSDHGQALGERRLGGRFGHGHPMCPETVDVPIVFLGAGLPESETYDPLLSSTDIAPTLLSAQRGVVSDDVDGTDLWQGVPDPDRRPRSDIWQHLEVGRGRVSGKVSIYAATSVWDADGGYVFHRKSRAQRLGTLLYDNVARGYGPAWRRNLTVGKFVTWLSLLTSTELTFGEPGFTTSEARTLAPAQFALDGTDVAESTLTQDQKNQLRDLGYLR